MGSVGKEGGIGIDEGGRSKVKSCPKISPILLKNVPKLFESCPKLSQSCFKIPPESSQSCPEVVPNFFRLPQVAFILVTLLRFSSESKVFGEGPSCLRTTSKKDHRHHIATKI